MQLPSLNITIVPASQQDRLTALSTTEQRLAFCGYLLDSVSEQSTLAFFDIDATLFCNFIEAAERLSRPARLALAISLLSDVLITIQEEQAQFSLDLLATALKRGGELV